MKVLNVRMSEEQFAAIQAAANKKGMGVSTFIRMAAISEAEANGFHATQPRAD